MIQLFSLTVSDLLSYSLIVASLLFILPLKASNDPIVLNDKTREWIKITHDEDYYLDPSTRPPLPDDTYKSLDTEIFVGISTLHDSRYIFILQFNIIQINNIIFWMKIHIFFFYNFWMKIVFLKF